MLLVVDQLFDGIVFGEAWHQAFSMFVYASDQIARDANVESAMAMLGERRAHARELTPYWAPGTSPGVTNEF